MKCNVGGGSFSHFSEEARKQKGRGINESMQDTRWRVEWPLTHGGKLLVGGGLKYPFPPRPLLAPTLACFPHIHMLSLFVLLQLAFVCALKVTCET